MLPAPELLLPWESTGEEDRRFWAVLRSMLVVFSVFAIVVPLLPVHDVARKTLRDMPPQLAHIIVDKQSLPEPVKPLPRPVTKKPEAPRRVEKQKDVAKPVPKNAEAPVPVEQAAVKPRGTSNQVGQLEQARSVAAASGVLAFQDELSAMRDSVDVATLNHTQMSRGQDSAAATERSVITSGVRASSGGIKTGAISRDTGGDAVSGRETTLSSRETTRVQSTIAARGRETGQSESVQHGGRSDESIRRIMDGNKGAIFAIYNRALRTDPQLQGKLVFEMVIDPAGSVVQITLVSSELSDAGLTSKILSRIRLINFGAEDVVNTRVNYSFDFLPYT
jgi:periplasmic protein TonB